LKVVLTRAMVFDVREKNPRRVASLKIFSR